MNNFSRKVLAGFSAATLAIGLVACSSEEVSDAVNDAGAAASSVANDAGAAASSVVNDVTGDDETTAADASDVVETTSNNAEEPEQGEMAVLNTADGEAEVPAAFAAAIEERVAEWGPVQKITNEAAGSLAEFDAGNLLAFASENQTAVPLVGKIAESWLSEGGLDAGVGLPTAPEAAEGNGWVQQFLNGTISWAPGANGEYEATINETVE